MRRTLALFAIASLLATGAIYATAGTSGPPHKPTPAPSPQPEVQKQPKVDIVIALDTSGSMSGLINAARQRLWDIVSEVAKAQPTPRLRVGLVTYGSGGTEQDGYVKIRKNLTEDLDSVYGKLFELTTDGGTEYVARAIQRSLKELSWDEDPDTLRQIYVAGNEPANQDRQVSLTEALGLAKKQDVFVNAIFCGPERGYAASGWRAVAQGGRGLFAAIDHNNGTIAVTTPYDRKLSQLSAKLSGTYLRYGAEGSRRLANQVRQDANARTLSPSAAAARAIAKASPVYKNDSWDLVDARKAGKLRKIPKAALPAKLRGMSHSQLEAHVEKEQSNRESIRKQIVALKKKRASYLKAELKRQGKDKGKSFGYAMKRALRKQAKSKKFRFKK